MRCSFYKPHRLILKILIRSEKAGRITSSGGSVLRMNVIYLLFIHKTYVTNMSLSIS